MLIYLAAYAYSSSTNLASFELPFMTVVLKEALGKALSMTEQTARQALEHVLKYMIEENHFMNFASLQEFLSEPAFSTVRTHSFAGCSPLKELIYKTGYLDGQPGS